jgi:DNA-binding transcriptional regulator YiaG
MKTIPLDTLLAKHMTGQSIARAKRRAREILEELELAEIRKALNVSQRGLARTMKIAQPTLAKIEKQPDMQIATLRKVVRALGGDIDIIARFPKASVRVRFAEMTPST